MKYFITLLFLSLISSLLFFSVPSYSATLYKISSAHPDFCFTNGDVVSSGAISSCTFTNSGKTVNRCFIHGSTIQCRYPSGSFMEGSSFSTVSSCPSGYELSASGVCVKPPTCEEGQILDGSMENCIDDPNTDWCSEQSANEYNACYESNGIFDWGAWQCNEQTHVIESSKCDMTNSNQCYYGQPAYPACLGDSDDIKGPDASYDPETPEPSTPEPGYDKSEPDPVTPEDSTDTAVLAAVQNMNRDLNDANTKISKDMNEGFGKLNDTLGQTNNNLDALGKVLENAVGQDTQARREAADFYQGNLAALGSIEGAVQGLTGDISDLGDRLTEAFTGSAQAFSCDSFTCEGNAAACFIARQQWDDKCKAQSQMVNFSSDIAEIVNYMQDTAEGYVDEDGGMKGIYSENSSTMEDYLSAYTQDNGFNFSSGCPSPRTYNFSIHSSSIGITIDYSPFCTLALLFRALLMASASLGSLFLFAKYM